MNNNPGYRPPLMNDPSNDGHPSGQSTTYTDTSSISTQSVDVIQERERERTQTSGGTFGNMEHFPANNNGEGHANTDAGGGVAPPDQRGAYNIHPQGSNHPEAPYMRERIPYNAHDNQYHGNYAGGNSAAESVPPPQGYGYNHGMAAAYPPPPATTANTYQRYTFIIVCCLAITSFFQMSRGGLSGLSPISGGQSNKSLKNSWVPVNNNGPYYYNNRNGMAGGNNMNMNKQGNMQQNGAMLGNNNNMMQNNGNGNAAGTNTQNQQEGGANFLGQQQEESNMNIPGSETQAVETSSMETGAAVSGTEKYPLTELSHFKDNWDEWEVTDVS